MVEASNRDPGHGPETDFGFRRVTIEAHRERVRRIFDAVAPRYDLMNDLMSGGLHRLWKRTLLDRIDPRPGAALLDVAGGTGDVALGFLDRAGPRARAVICDSSAAMLASGRDRALDRGLVQGNDDVAHHQAGLGRRTVGLNRDDQQATLLAKRLADGLWQTRRLNANPKIALLDFAVG